MQDIRLRPARYDEATALSDLACRSKAHWGYDAAFMAQCRDELTVGQRHIDGALCLVAEDAAGLLGFIAADLVAADRAEITLFFVEPAAMGKGVGSTLLNRAIAMLEERGVAMLETAADPHAEGFYQRAGFMTVGREASTSIPGRSLPAVRRQLAPVMRQSRI